MPGRQEQVEALPHIIVNPTIVGGTIYLDNSWDWVIAVPVSEVNPSYRN